MSIRELDFTIQALGPGKYPSPIMLSKHHGDLIANYVSDEERVIFDINAVPGKSVTYEARHLIEKAGPRELVFFDPQNVNAAIVTCGGLCPGLNDVTRAIVMSLWHQYGVRKIWGVQFGYRGFLMEYGLPFVPLRHEVVSEIHRKGGTILGSSRGHGNRTADIVDRMEKEGINMLFTIGGDGTQRGTLRIAEEVERRGLNVTVVGIPKTIDNDLSFIEKSFGFETAVSLAVQAIHAAHVEAEGAPNGVGLVKVMGREAGFIAAYTVLGSGEVNYVLVPELRFDLEGDDGLFAHLERRLEKRGHAVIVVAEGAGQEHLHAASTEYDPSGNKKLGDIGHFLENRIKKHFADKGVEMNLKYIDPSYLIRAMPANPIDSIYCARLGTNAVHAAMAGKTKMLVSHVNDVFVHIPTELAVSKRNCIDPESPLWRDVIETTGQPPLMFNR
uniref:ATP-dependent 6-phosphofructokinase n=1 Tax=uncultured bacterium contig00093 TaxID=1181564 RepID=A0A806KJA9_9BACT|nr:pyrophosphate--fructose 6-phosphate 1-phosphotransferase, alpha subunit [uncultured bacterium contig00093]